MVTCENCGKEFESEQQLRGHNMKCRPQRSNISRDTINRKERIPFGSKTTSFANVPQNDGYHYHVFNDNWHQEPGRIQRAINAGYEFVDHPESGSTRGTNQDGSQIKGVLMRIPEEFHKEDLALKEEERSKIDAQIYGGTFQKQKGDGRYIPKEGISTETKLTP